MAGLKPEEYWDCCFAEACEMIQADEMRQVHDWRLNREITYIIYCANTLEKDRVSKTEWMTLPGDVVAKGNSKQDMIERWRELGYLT